MKLPGGFLRSESQTASAPPGIVAVDPRIALEKSRVGERNLNSFPSPLDTRLFHVGRGMARKPTQFMVIRWVLTLISVPRVYVGGHYPIHVLASLVLVIVVLALIWRWHVPDTCTTLKTFGQFEDR